MVTDYSLVTEPVSEPLSFQVTDKAETSHPIIEPRPRKPNQRNQSSENSRPSNGNESSEHTTVDGRNNSCSQPTLRRSPEVEFSSSVFQPPKKISTPKRSSSDNTKNKKEETSAHKETGDNKDAKHKIRAADIYEFKSGDELEDEEEFHKSDTSSEDEKEPAIKHQLNMTPTVKLQDIILSNSKAKFSERKERRKDRREHIIKKGEKKSELGRREFSSSKSSKVFNTRSKSKGPQFKRSLSSSSKTKKDRGDKKTSNNKNKGAIGAREINELQRDSYIEFTTGRPKRNLKPSLRKVESDMYVINSSEAYASNSRDSSRDKSSSRDKEKMSKSGAAQIGSRRESGSRSRSRSGSSRETSRERPESKERSFMSRFRSSRKPKPNKSGSRFGSSQYESMSRSGSRSWSSRETSKERHDSKDRYKVKTSRSGSNIKFTRKEAPPKATEKPIEVDKRHPIKRFHMEYQIQMATKGEEDENDGE